MNPDVAIIGGGLAGLTAALYLSSRGVEVVLFEKGRYPRHKVCGEYVSLEVKPLLESLGAFPAALDPVWIDRFRLTTVSGKTLQTDLPLGAFSISRYALDQFLADQASKAGANLTCGTAVTKVTPKKNGFLLDTSNGHTVTARLVIGCQGKRSSLDATLKRTVEKASPWLGIKQHVRWNSPRNEVQLHHFPGGYCGVSQIEDGLANLCYLVNKRQLQRFKTIPQLESELLSRNPELAAVIEGAERTWPKPMSIANVSFKIRNPVEQGILFAGDATGLISPLCGNGMAMAIQAAHRLAVLSYAFLEGTLSRKELETSYRRYWKREFAGRLRWGKILQSIFWRPQLMDTLVGLSKFSPSLTQTIISRTHGKPTAQAFSVPA